MEEQTETESEEENLLSNKEMDRAAPTGNKNRRFMLKDNFGYIRGSVGELHFVASFVVSKMGRGCQMICDPCHGRNRSEWRALTTYISVFLFASTGTVSRAIINPTIYLYVTTVFNAPLYWVGLITAAAAVPSIIAGPIVGKLADLTHESRRLILIIHLTRIVGMGMYSLGIAPWFLCLARFITGISTGAQSAVQTNMIRGSAASDRAAVLSVYTCSRRVGVALGPLCNLFLSEFNFAIGAIMINKYSAPGFFMFLVGVLCEIFFLVGYFDLEPPKEEQNNSIDRPQVPFVTQSENANEQRNVERQSSSVPQVLLRPNVLALMFSAFSTGFTQAAVEVGLHITAVKFYGLSTVQLSWLSFALSAVSVMVFLTVRPLSKRLSDPQILLLSLLPNTIGIIWPAACQIFYLTANPMSFWSFVIGTGFFFVGQPIAWLSSKSIFSKSVNKEQVGFFFGLRETVVYAAGQILGSLWTATIGQNLVAFWSVVLALQCVSMTLYAISWKSIRSQCLPRRRPTTSPPTSSNTVSEDPIMS